ncbi:MAG: FlhC family transcriptional regulator [Alphaproteobacteria bacterium]
MPSGRLADCSDPVVQHVCAQMFALELLQRGIRPKQVAIITRLSNKRVNRLREGLLPVADRTGRPTLSTGTILRRAELRAAGSLFVEIYQRVIGNDLSDYNWPLFLESYDVYATQSAIVANGFPEARAVLAIEDACTLVLSLHRDQLRSVRCETHGTHYLIIPNHSRGWRCPYCTCAERDHALVPQASLVDVARMEPFFGVHAGNTDREERDRVGA